MLRGPIKSILSGSSSVPVPLTFSGHEITPASRAAGVQGDGLKGPYANSSIGVWEATTNLVTNGGFETNTTGANAGTGVTATSSTEQAKFGSRSLKLVSDGANIQAIRIPYTTTQSTVYTHYVWIYRTEVTDTLTLQARNNASSADIATAVIPAVLGWQQVSITYTTEALQTTGHIRIVGTGTSVTTFYLDGVQAEAQPIATPYVETDGGTASRTASRLQIANIRRYINETQGWIVALARMGWGNAAEPGSAVPQIFLWGDDANNRFTFGYQESANSWNCNRIATSSNAAVLADTVAASDVVGVVVAWTATTIAVSADGGAFTSVANTAIPTLSTTSADIFSGGTVSGSREFDSDLLFFAMGKGTLSNADAAALNNIARNNRIDSRVEDLPGACTFKWPSPDLNWRTGMAL